MHPYWLVPNLRVQYFSANNMNNMSEALENGSQYCHRRNLKYFTKNVWNVCTLKSCSTLFAYVVILQTV